MNFLNMMENVYSVTFIRNGLLKKQWNPKGYIHQKQFPHKNENRMTSWHHSGLQWLVNYLNAAWTNTQVRPPPQPYRGFQGLQWERHSLALHKVHPFFFFLLVCEDKCLRALPAKLLMLLGRVSSSPLNYDKDVNLMWCKAKPQVLTVTEQTV